MSWVNKSLQPWKVLQSKTVHSTPWIEIIEDNCLADGKTLTYTYTRRVEEGPLMIAVENDGKLWLVRQYRHPIKKIIWQFPVEGKKKDESWEEAAVRGLKEELQLEAKEMIDVGEFFPDPGGLEQKYRAYVMRGLSKTREDNDHQEGEVESLEKQSFSLEEVDSMIVAGEVCDNWTLAALYLYKRHLEKIL